MVYSTSTSFKELIQSPNNLDIVHKRLVNNPQDIYDVFLLAVDDNKKEYIDLSLELKGTRTWYSINSEYTDEFIWNAAYIYALYNRNYEVLTLAVNNSEIQSICIGITIKEFLTKHDDTLGQFMVTVLEVSNDAIFISAVIYVPTCEEVFTILFDSGISNKTIVIALKICLKKFDDKVYKNLFKKIILTLCNF